MATFIIGDLQGCFRTLETLLAAIQHNESRDRLWFAGDLVNRGPDSLGCLRFVRTLGHHAACVLGNHDLHLLAVAHGVRASGKHDTLQDVLDAPDGPELFDWLRMQPLLHNCGPMTMVHAAIPPAWDPQTAFAAAHEVECVLRGPDFISLLRNMYGDTPSRWCDTSGTASRCRYVINALTRARCFDASGAMDLRFKGPPEAMPQGLLPWYQTLHPGWRGNKVFAGHWSAAGIRQGEGFAMLDSGCVWGGALTAYCLETGQFTSVPCVAGDRASGAE